HCQYGCPRNGTARDGIARTAIGVSRVYWQPYACCTQSIVYRCHDHLADAVGKELRSADHATSLWRHSKSVAIGAKFIDRVAAAHRAYRGNGGLLCLIIRFVHAEGNPVTIGYAHA